MKNDGAPIPFPIYKFIYQLYIFTTSVYLCVCMLASVSTWRRRCRYSWRKMIHNTLQSLAWCVFRYWWVSQASRLTSFFIVFMFGLFSIYFVFFLYFIGAHSHTPSFVSIKFAEYSLCGTYKGAMTYAFSTEQLTFVESLEAAKSG